MVGVRARIKRVTGGLVKGGRPQPLPEYPCAQTVAVSVFRKPSNNTHGNTRDRQGRLVSCEHDARRVTRTEHDGAIIGKIHLPAPCANLCFGGVKKNRLFMTASQIP